MRTGSSVLDDREDDDDNDDYREDRPPRLLSTENSGEDTEEDSGEDEVLYSRRCLTCQFVCRCPVDISSSQDELVVGETSAPSSNLRRGKKKLENILDKTFSHEIWKYGKIVEPNQPDSDSDEDDPNVPFEWKSLPHSEKKRNLCADLHLDNNPILDAEPAQRDRLQDLVVQYSDIWTDGLSYNAGSMPSVPFITARVM